MPRPMPEPEDDDRALLAKIARVGWAVIAIPEDEVGPGFAFSLGLYHSHSHPEIIVTGLPWNVSYPLINDAGTVVRDGGSFVAGRKYAQLSIGFPLAFEPVERIHFREYLGTAIWFYRSLEFPVNQMVWPDRQGQFPWDADAKFEYRRSQPLLFN